MTRSRRTLLFSVAALAALGVAALIFVDHDERRIRKQIAALEAALASRPDQDRQARAAHLAQGLSESVAHDVVVEIPDYPELTRGRAGLADVAERAGDDREGLALVARDVEVRFDSERQAASVSLRAELSRPGDELHKDVRDVRLRFERRAGAWLVTSIQVAPRSHEQPEARP
jgi:hypothetical protein